MSLMTPDELERELERKQLHPVYLLLGPEEYLRSRTVRMLKDAVLTPEAAVFNYAEFAASSEPLGEMLEILNTFPMMGPRRMVLLSEIDAMDQPDQKRLVAYVSQPADRSVLLGLSSDQRASRFGAWARVRALSFPYRSARKGERPFSGSGTTRARGAV